MDILNKYVKNIDIPITEDELEERKIRIKILKTYDGEEFFGLYKIDYYLDKKPIIICPNRLRRRCNKVCKNYCAVLKNEIEDRYVWLCNVKSWKKV